MKIKEILLNINNSYIFFCSSVYLGMFFTLHFFFFPNYPHILHVNNYYDAIIPQTDTATRYFFVSIPIMSVCLVIMLITEWKTKFRWVPLAWIPGLLAPVITQQKWIEDINNQFKAGVTDEVKLHELLNQWMFLNDVRFYILAVMWGITLYYFIAKAQKF
ncbi:MAG: hypothetical protein ABI723_03565 [Bacteroidia bacterium]